MGIRHVGVNTAKDIAGHFGSFEVFWMYLLSEVEREVERKLESDRDEIEKVNEEEEGVKKDEEKIEEERDPGRLA